MAILFTLAAIDPSMMPTFPHHRDRIPTTSRAAKQVEDTNPK